MRYDVRRGRAHPVLTWCVGQAQPLGGLDQVGIGADDGPVERIDLAPAGVHGRGVGTRAEVSTGEAPERVSGAYDDQVGVRRVRHRAGTEPGAAGERPTARSGNGSPASDDRAPVPVQVARGRRQAGAAEPGEHGRTARGEQQPAYRRRDTAARAPVAASRTTAVVTSHSQTAQSAATTPRAGRQDLVEAGSPAVRPAARRPARRSRPWRSARRRGSERVKQTSREPCVCFRLIQETPFYSRNQPSLHSDRANTRGEFREHCAVLRQPDHPEVVSKSHVRSGIVGSDPAGVRGQWDCRYMGEVETDFQRGASATPQTSAADFPNYGSHGAGAPETRRVAQADALLQFGNAMFPWAESVVPDLAGLPVR